MICLYCELHAYLIMSPMPATIHNGQHLLICRMVILLCRSKFPGVKSNWVQFPIQLLVEDSANSKARSVCMKFKGSLGILRVEKFERKGRLSCIFDHLEDCLFHLPPLAIHILA